jgi:hypothetical protein
MRGSAGWHVPEKLRAAEKLEEGKMSFRSIFHRPALIQAIFQAPDLLLL